MRRGPLIGGIIVLVVVVLVVILVTKPAGNSSPAAETAFINGMTPIMAQMQNPAGVQDIAGWRQKRAAMICQTIPNLQVTNWTGTVDKLDTSISGGAVLSIAVMPNVDFGTAPNVVSNLGSNTLIDPGLPLYQTISGLQVGQKIVFSGQLFSSSTDCIQEASATDNGSMQNPLFITRFTAITPLPHSDN